MDQPPDCTCPTTALLSTGHLPDCPTQNLPSDATLYGFPFEFRQSPLLEANQWMLGSFDDLARAKPPVRVESHLAIVRITRETLACLLLPPKGKAFRFRGIPEGAILLCARDDFHRGSIEIMLQHPSFDPVPCGDELPRLDVTVELVDIK